MSTAELPLPPSTNVVNLSIASIVIYVSLLPVAVYITWRHGKSGLVAWPILISHFGLVLAFYAYKLAIRDDPEIPDVVLIMLNAGIIVCPTLVLLGAVYEANIIVFRGKWYRAENLVLGTTHILNTTGIALATYGGSPSATEPRSVLDYKANWAGNMMMISVLVLLCIWVIATVRRLTRARSHLNFRPACALLIAVCFGLPPQMVRLAYDTTYAFYSDYTLDPLMGTFATRLILVFGTQFATTLAMLAGGWFSRRVAALPAQEHLELCLEESLALHASRSAEC